MKTIFTFTILIFTGFLLGAQTETEQVAIGAGYVQHTYYNLEDGQTTSYDHTEWDIAFSVTPGGFGIFVNEGVGSSMSGALPTVELYEALDIDFATVDTAGMIRIYNDEISWEEGAFNHVKVDGDPLDLGWGAYDPGTRHVNGNRVFIIKLRDDSFKKMEIQSLISGVYTFRYADLDGSNEEIKTVAKSDFPAKVLAFYSFATGNARDMAPATWDMVFTRYVTPLDAGGGATIDYTLTGVLSGPGVEVVQADGIEPLSVDHTAYENDYSDSLAIIGHDWKSFDLSTFQWLLPEDRVYFVKTAGGAIWKLQFIDFEGSSTGVTTVQRTFLTQTTSLNNISEYAESIELFPNPASDELHISYDLKSTVSQATLRLINSLGQTISTREIDRTEGFHVLDLNVSHFPAGVYHASLQIGDERISKSFFVR